MASFFSVAVFFIYSMLMFHPDIERGILGEMSLIGMVGAEIVLVLFTLFFLYYSMSAFLEARSHEFAILLHLGMEKRQMNKLSQVHFSSFPLLVCILHERENYEIL